MNRRKFILGSGVALSATVAGCTGDTDYEDGNGGDDSSGSSDSAGNGDDDDGEPDVEEDVEILEHELVREDEGTMSEQVSVEGRAENTGDDQLMYVEVRVRFYNEDGDMLESSLDNINDFDPGQTWAFDAMYFGMGDDAAEIDDYDIAVGTNF